MFLTRKHEYRIAYARLYRRGERLLSQEYDHFFKMGRTTALNRGL